MRSRSQSPQRAATADAEDEPGYTVTFLTARGCFAGTRAQVCEVAPLQRALVPEVAVGVSGSGQSEMLWHAYGVLDMLFQSN